MGTAAFALLFLASGYIALRCTPFTRFHAIHTDGHALYFLVVASALAISALSAITVHELFKIPGLGPSARSLLERFLRTFVADKESTKFGSIAVLSAPIAFFTARLLGLPLRRSAILRSRLLTSLRSVGELEGFLCTATARNIPVMLTMSSGDAYVGTSIGTTAPKDHRRWIRLEPLLAGIIDERRQFNPTVSYARAYPSHTDGSSSSSEDFDIFLPLEEVHSVSMFDLPTYRHPTTRESPRNLMTVQRLSTDTPKAIRFYVGYVVVLLSLPLVSLTAGPLWLAGAATCCALLALASSLPEDF